MEGTKNGTAFENLSFEEQNVFLKQYGEYPLKDYVDWESYYNSDDGNVMNFVHCIGECRNDNGERLLILDRLTIDDSDYMLVYNCEDNSFYTMPDTLDFDYELVGNESGDVV